MFVQIFIKLSAAVRELPCWQSFDDTENNTAVGSARDGQWTAHACCGWVHALGGVETSYAAHQQSVISDAWSLTQITADASRSSGHCSLPLSLHGDRTNTQRPGLHTLLICQRRTLDLTNPLDATAWPPFNLNNTLRQKQCITVNNDQRWSPQGLSSNSRTGRGGQKPWPWPWPWECWLASIPSLITTQFSWRQTVIGQTLAVNNAKWSYLGEIILKLSRFFNRFFVYLFQALCCVVG